MVTDMYGTVKKNIFTIIFSLAVFAMFAGYLFGEPLLQLGRFLQFLAKPYTSEHCHLRHHDEAVPQPFAQQIRHSRYYLIVWLLTADFWSLNQYHIPLLAGAHGFQPPRLHHHRHFRMPLAERCIFLFVCHVLRLVCSFRGQNYKKYLTFANISANFCLHSTQTVQWSSVMIVRLLDKSCTNHLLITYWPPTNHLLQHQYCIDDGWIMVEQVSLSKISDIIAMHLLEIMAICQKKMKKMHFLWKKILELLHISIFFRTFACLINGLCIYSVNSDIICVLFVTYRPYLLP